LIFAECILAEIKPGNVIKILFRRKIGFLHTFHKMTEQAKPGYVGHGIDIGSFQMGPGLFNVEHGAYGLL